MDKKSIDKIIALISLSAAAYFSWIGYELYSRYQFYNHQGNEYAENGVDNSGIDNDINKSNEGDNSKQRMDDSCTYRLYTWKKPTLNVCTATAALDCSYSVEDTVSFPRTCTSSTICTEIQKVEENFTKACALSSAPDNDLLLKILEKERNQLLRDDGSYVLCEKWECSSITKCYQEDCVSCGTAEIKTAPCTFLFPEYYWRTRWR